MKVLLLGALVSIFTGCLDYLKPKEKKNYPKIKILKPDGSVLFNNKDNSILPNITPIEFNVNKAIAYNCYTSICGEPVESRLLRVSDSYFSLNPLELETYESIQGEIEDAYWPQIEPIIEQLHQENKDDARVAKQLFDLLPINRELRLSEMGKNFLKFKISFDAFSKYQELADGYDYDEDNELFYLSESQKSLLEGIEINRINSYLGIASRFIKEINESGGFTLEEYGLRIFLLRVYPERETRESINEFRESIKRFLDNLKDRSQLLYKAVSSDLAIKKFVDGQALDDTEQKDLGQSLSMISILNGLIISPWEELGEVELDLERLAYSEVKTDIDNKFELLDSIESEEKHIKDISSVKNICTLSLSAHIATRPSQSEIDLTNSQIEILKGPSKKIAKRIYPLSDYDQIDHLIDNIAFDLPISPSQSKVKITDSIMTLYKIMEPTSNLDLVDASNLVEVEEFISLSYVMDGLFDSSNEEEEEENEYESIVDFCLTFLPKGLSDGSLTVDNRILTSARTVKEGIKGIGVIAHEIGHRLENDIVNRPSESLNQCLISRHTNQEDFSLHDSLYYSEDFADFFSSEVLTELNKTAKGFNLGCLLIKNYVYETSDKGIERSPFKTNFSDLHFLIGKDGDTHSSSLLRLLQIADDLGHSNNFCDSYKNLESGKIIKSTEGVEFKTPVTSSCN